MIHKDANIIARDNTRSSAHKTPLDATNDSRPIPNVLDTKELKSMAPEIIQAQAESLGIENAGSMLKQELVFAILKKTIEQAGTVFDEGVLEILAEGFGFLRSAEANYLAGPGDIYISPSQIKKFGLRNGDVVSGQIRSPKTGERYFALSRVTQINMQNVSHNTHRVNFDNLTPIYPCDKFNLEYKDPSIKDLSTKVIDIVAPLGKGQRALIVAPPRSGKTALLQAVARAITDNHPEAFLMVLLIDERPEEMTDMKRSVRGEVIGSTFDEPASRHIQLAELAIEKAKRLVESKKDVVVLLDSITRLARAYNTVVPSSGKVLTGGVDANALQRPKRLFGAARNIEQGGSLTIIGTTLVETGSRMDDVIFEEFKGTGNSEIVLDRRIADRRIHPAMDITRSGTRQEQKLVPAHRLAKMWALRRVMGGMGALESLEYLLDKVESIKTIEEFFEAMNAQTKS